MSDIDPGKAGTDSPETSARPEGNFSVPPPDLLASIAIRSPGEAGDGAITIRVTEDWMSATATFHPPREDGRPLSLELVSELLASKGVSDCVHWDLVKQKILECNLERKSIRDIEIAHGIEPVASVPEHGAIEERFAPKDQFASIDAIKVDFKNLSRRPVVRKGEVIAHVIPGVEGRTGRDLRGKDLEAPHSRVDNWRAGKNVVLEDGKLVAAIDGLLNLADLSFSVEEVFVVKGGVDYHTGHIIFPGDVVVEGKVMDGFKLWSGGNILCKLTLDAFDVNAKKDLVCQQGILGHGKGHVRVGGQLSAKFIENCRVAVRGDIHVTTALMGSNVYSLGIVNLGDKGAIIGGETWSVHGIRAARLGNQAGQLTAIHAGVDFTAQQRLDEANERLQALALKARKIDGYAAEHPGVDAARLHAEADKAIDSTRNIIVSLLPSLDGDEGATVEVTGEIWPGVTIGICRSQITVTKALRNCRFRLDKAHGRVLVEPLGGGQAAAPESTRAEEVTDRKK